jgi:hypothetical protein
MTNGVAIEAGPFTNLAATPYETDLTLTFYNWPPLDRLGWKRNIIDVVAEVLGTRPSIAWAKV